MQSVVGPHPCFSVCSQQFLNHQFSLLPTISYCSGKLAMNTRPNSAKLIMVQEPVHDLDHELVSGITVKCQLNPIGLEIKDKSVPRKPVLRLNSALRQLERYDWMFSHNIVFLRIQLLRTVYDFYTRER